MRFNRKQKNKRFERKHVLKVKLRTSQQRQIRLRKAAWGILVPSLVALAIYLSWRGGRAFLDWAIYRNPFFEIHRLAIETDGIIHKEQIRQWTGVQLGQNLFALDLSRVRRDLELIPSIASAEIERILPDKLRIRVSERDPVARFFFPNLSDASPDMAGTYTLDAEGVFMVPLAPNQCTVPQDSSIETLPFITGIPLLDLRPGREVQSPQAKAALDLITAFDRSPMFGLVELREIDVRTSGLLRVTTSQNSHITFGLENIERQLYRWRAVHEHGLKHGRRVATLDLSVTNNVPLVWLNSDQQPAPDLKTIKSNRTRKKNV